MMRAIDTLKNPRKVILDTLSSFSTEQLNKIPAGFNNNIIWNLGHIIASQQGISYKRAGLELTVPESFFDTYKSGSKPERFISEEECNEVKELLFTTLDKLEEDYAAALFGNYTPVMTRYNVELTNIDEALGFLPFHDGLHIGYMMSLRKLV
jgi:hypothetical protein